MDIVKAIRDPKLFLPVFRGNLKSWSAWITLLRAFFAIKMGKRDLTLFRRCTGRTEPPGGEFKELWCVCGRREVEKVLWPL